MTLQTIHLSNFRNYKKNTFDLHPKLNMVVGPNGSGKTNLLEALYVLGQTKSYRVRDELLITHKESWFSLEALGASSSQKITYKTEPKKRKTIYINNTPRKPEDYIGSLPLVLFEPNSVQIATGAPLNRRQYFDGVLCNVDRTYLVNLIQYRRVVKQRNALLRSKNKDLKDQLFAWDIKLADLGAYIYQKRMDFLAFLQSSVSDLYKRLTGEKVDISLQYQTSCDPSDYSSSLMGLLEANLARDEILGNTGDGIHRDDIAIVFNASPVVATASRGEVRSLILALKLLELEYIEKSHSQKPLVLLDDVFSELDVGRRELLLGGLTNYQSLITTTDLHGIKDLPVDAHAIITLGSENARRRKTVSSQKSPRARPRARRRTGRNSENS